MFCVFVVDIINCKCDEILIIKNLKTNHVLKSIILSWVIFIILKLEIGKETKIINSMSRVN